MSMARDVESVHTFTHEPKYRLNKEMCVVRCDDGTVYEFEKPTDEPHFTLAHSIQPDGELRHTTTKGRLPSAVEETVSVLLNGWSK
jgi:hypothetical protein